MFAVAGNIIRRVYVELIIEEDKTTEWDVTHWVAGMFVLFFPLLPGNRLDKRP